MKNDVTNQLRLLRWLNDQGFKFMICLGPKQLENQDFNPFYATSFFYTSWKHQQSRGFVMISLGIEKSSAMKCVSMGFLVSLFWLLCKIFSWTAYNSWTARKFFENFALVFGMWLNTLWKQLLQSISFLRMCSYPIWKKTYVFYYSLIYLLFIFLIHCLRVIILR